MRISTAFSIPFRFVGMLSIAIFSPMAAQAQTSSQSVGESERVERVNSGTVGIVGGSLSGTFIRFAAELATVLDDGDNLRVLPIVSNGATNNVTDLLYLKGVDLAITHTDVFEEFKVRRNVSNINKRLNYVSQMYVSETHLYVRPEINSIQDLDGKTVGLHVKGAGQTTTGPIVFERNGVSPNFVFVNNKIGLEKMKTGEFAAIFHNGGKPNPLFRDLEPAEPGFKFISIPYSEKFADYYVPSQLTHDDYPKLIKEGEIIESLGIPVVLAVYNWPEGTPRHRKVSNFIEYYFDRFDRLRQPPFHPKWKGINLGASVPGWTRFPPAQRKLDQMSTESRVGSSVPANNSAAQELARALGIETADEQKLFTEFMKWRQQQDGQ
ncbi:MAG: C4-dicarboxylate ABC transporter [Hyphomicrobiales bacterium]|nr:C4-dicarboxylate ABC transporter [Hyphomicrobiales bacterium]